MAQVKKNAFWSKSLIEACQRIEEQQTVPNIKRMANALVKKACEGDVAALKEIGDRLEGKPAQTLRGDADNPLTMSFQGLNVNFVKPDTGSSDT